MSEQSEHISDAISSRVMHVAEIRADAKVTSFRAKLRELILSELGHDSEMYEAFFTPDVESAIQSCWKLLEDRIQSDIIRNLVDTASA
jgi:hypothetical protein